MHDTLSPAAHGLLDYITVLVFALAPTLFQFEGVPALVAYGLAGAHLVLTLTTRFPMGMFDGVPLRAHGVAELVVSAALIVLPWVAGFIQPGAQWFFPVMGIYVFVVWLLSDYGRLAPVGGPTEGTRMVPSAEEDSIPGGRHPEGAVGPGEERPGPATGTTTEKGRQSTPRESPSDSEPGSPPRRGRADAAGASDEPEAAPGHEGSKKQDS